MWNRISIHLYFQSLREIVKMPMQQHLHPHDLTHQIEIIVVDEHVGVYHPRSQLKYGQPVSWRI